MAARPVIKLAPSILSADFARLGEQVAEAERGGADYIHVDVMDGRFVPNLTIGPTVVRWLRPWTRLPLDVHLMVVEPERLIPEFVAAGADILTVHAEACTHVHRVLMQIRGLGARAGLALNPATSVASVEEALPYADLVLAMTVNPGFPGQHFIEGVVPKVVRLRHLLDKAKSEAELEVDGGINSQTASQVTAAGARVLVAGSAVYASAEGVAAAIAKLRSSAEAGLR